MKPETERMGECTTTADRLFAMSKDRIDRAGEGRAPPEECWGEGGYCRAVENMALATTTLCMLTGDMTPGEGFPANPRDPTCRACIPLVFAASAKITKKVCAGACGRGAGGLE